MNCSQAHDLLQQRLDGEPIAASTELERHLSECLACRGLHAAAGRLQEGLRLRVVPLPPASLATTIAVQVLRDRRERQQARRRWFVGAAMAAGLLLAVALGMGYSTAPNPVKQLFHALGWMPADPVVSITPPPLALPSTPVPAPVPSLRETMAEAGTAVVSLTRRTAGETFEDTKLLTGALPAAPALPVPPMAESPPVPSLGQAGQHVASGFEPVTNSARRAVNLFLRDTGTTRNQ